MATLSKQCASCSSTNATKLCGGCKQMVYCSKICQRNHWLSHKKECKLLRKEIAKKQRTMNKDKQNHNQDVLFAMNIQQKYKKEIKKQRQPKFNIDEPINGIIKFTISNDFLINNTKLLRFDFKYKCTNNSNLKWKSVYFTSNKINKKGEFWIRMRLQLYSSKIKCKLRAQYDNDNNTGWFEWSKLHTVNIPSSLVDIPYKIGDFIKYRPEHEFYAYGRGRIIDILDGNYLKIVDSNTRKQCIISSDRLSTNRIAFSYLIDINNKEWISDKRLTIKNDNKNVSDIYIALSNIYSDYAMIYNPNKKKKWDTLDGPYFDIGKFIAGNIVKFLYLPEYSWKIGCILNCNHGLLNYCNLMRHFIEMNMKSRELGLKKVVEVDNTWQWCDICHVSAHIFQSTFHCNANMADSHDYCTKCINDIITKHNELQELLQDMLMENLNNDCIQMIVTFVIGKVIKVYVN